MADEKLTALVVEGAPVDADLLYLVIDVATTPLSRGVTYGSLLHQTSNVQPRTDNLYTLGTIAGGYKAVHFSNMSEGDGAGPRRHAPEGHGISEGLIPRRHRCDPHS